MNVVVSLPPPASGREWERTVDGKPLFDGALLFSLKATHGLPLDFAVGRIFDEDFAVDWVEFVKAARRNGWLDAQIFDAVRYALLDAGAPREIQSGITSRLANYMEH